MILVVPISPAALAPSTSTSCWRMLAHAIHVAPLRWEVLAALSPVIHHAYGALLVWDFAPEAWGDGRAEVIAPRIPWTGVMLWPDEVQMVAEAIVAAASDEEQP